MARRRVVHIALELGGWWSSSRLNEHEIFYTGFDLDSSGSGCSLNICKI
jgi:hypothetical protein